MYHHTKNKGDYGVFKAKLDLVEKGWMILQPLTEHSPFDLVAYKDGVFKRVQVKYRSLDKSGCIKVKFANTWSDKNGTHEKPIDKDAVDLYCLYCPESDKCYYCCPKDFNATLTLRINESKNKQIKNVIRAEDFLTF